MKSDTNVKINDNYDELKQTTIVIVNSIDMKKAGIKKIIKN